MNTIHPEPDTASDQPLDLPAPAPGPQRRRRAALLVNRRAGAVASMSGEEVVRRARERWDDVLDVAPSLLEPDEVDGAIRASARDPAVDVVIVAGGDGTISHAVHHLATTEKTLAVLPGGTLNLLARELGMPRSLVDAIDALSTAPSSLIDVGEINGRRFVLHTTLGLHPWMVRRRDEQAPRSRAEKIWNTTRYFVRALWRAPALSATLTVDDWTAEVRTRLIVVTVGTVERGVGPAFRRRRLDEGRLVLYHGSDERGVKLLRGIAEATFQPWHRIADLQAAAGQRITIDVAHDPIPVVLDGELVSLTPPLRLRVLPRALRVLSPADET